MSLNRFIVHLFVYVGMFCQANATTVRISDLNTMASKSDVVIRAKVIGTRVKFDELGRIVTITDLKVLEGFKGAAAGEIKTVYQVGGQINNKVYRVLGAHNYKIGNELFLFGLNLGDMVVSYGVGLGKFNVLTDAKGSRVVEELHDLVVVKEDLGGKSAFEEPSPRQFPSVDAFRNAVHTALNPPKYRVIKSQVSKARLHKPKGQSSL